MTLCSFLHLMLLPACSALGVFAVVLPHEADTVPKHHAMRHWALGVLKPVFQHNIDLRLTVVHASRKANCPV